MNTDDLSDDVLCYVLLLCGPHLRLSVAPLVCKRWQRLAAHRFSWANRFPKARWRLLTRATAPNTPGRGPGGFDIASGLAIDHERDELFVACQNMKRLQVLDLRTGAFVRWIGRDKDGEYVVSGEQCDDEVPSLGTPVALTYVRRTGDIVVADYGKSVHFFEAATGRHLARVDEGMTNPRSICASAHEDLLFVGDNGSSHIHVLSALDRTVLQHITHITGVSGVAYLPSYEPRVQAAPGGSASAKDGDDSDADDSSTDLNHPSGGGDVGRRAANVSEAHDALVVKTSGPSVALCTLTGDLLTELVENSGSWIPSIDVSPNGRLIAYADQQEEAIIVYEVYGRQERRRIPLKSCVCVRFVSDDQLLYTSWYSVFACFL